MDTDVRRGWEPLSAIACVLAFGMVVVYLVVINGQDAQPAAWFLAALVIAGLLAAYGTARSAPRRGPMLLAGGLVLLLSGTVSILSIGLPILVAGVLAIVASVRASRGAQSVRQFPARPR